jgi:hypothetical protein
VLQTPGRIRGSTFCVWRTRRTRRSTASGSVAIWKGMSKPQAVSARHVVVPELVSFVAEIK